MKKLFGFTLAEVLITLGIIGVVAAMTMPSLIANYQKKQVVAQLKKAYTSVSNALQMAKAEHGDFELWDYSDSNDIQASSDFSDEYLIPYLNVIKTCATDTSGGCEVEFTQLNGGSYSSSALAQYTRFVLNDGTWVFVRAAVNAADSVFPKIIYINIDINGLKRPNKFGRDYFCFAVVLDTTQDMYRPTGKLNASGQSQTIETIKSNCSKEGTGDYCAAWVMHNNWEIPKDYPW